MPEVEDVLADEEPKKKPSSGKKWIVLAGAVFLVLTLTGGGLYWFGFFSEAKASSHEEARKEETHHEEVTEVVQLESLVVNLADTDQIRYARVGVSLGVVNKDSHHPAIDPSLTLPKIKDYLVTSLSKKTAVQLISAESKETLKKEILAAVQKMVSAEHGKVLEVYITELLVQ